MTIPPGEHLTRDATGEARRALLAVSVLDDVTGADDAGGAGSADLVPGDGGMVLEVTRAAGPPRRVHLPWAAAAAVIGPWSAGSPQARARLVGWLRTHAAIATAADPAGLVRDGARAVAVVVGGQLHPGPGTGWVRARVPGGVLEVGVGLVLPGTRIAEPLWPDAAAAAGLDAADLDAVWAACDEHALRMGALCARRVSRDLGAPGHPDGVDGAGARLDGSRRTTRGGPDAARALVLRPVGGCDVLTLLATSPVRRVLADRDPIGMAVVAAPDRTRGWCDTRRVESDFLLAAWSATAPRDRGVPWALLVTADEVSRGHRP